MASEASEASEGGEARSARQRLGRRLGLAPYYELAEGSPTLLRLESRPTANRAYGQGLLLTGGLLIVVAAAIAFSGLYAAGSGAGFAVAALGAVVGAALGAIGYQRVFGGYAVATTVNRIVADAAAQTIVFTQGNKVAPPRSQSLPFAAVRAMRLRRRSHVVGGIARRVRPVVALELVADGDEVWIIDSAEQPEELRPVAEALGALLGMELARE